MIVMPILLLFLVFVVRIKFYSSGCCFYGIFQLKAVTICDALSGQELWMVLLGFRPLG